jgi:hypothetical protein
MTNFEKAVEAAKNGNLKTPSVSMGNKQIDYFGYQLANHKFALGILASGMKIRNVRLKDIKDYYGLKGKSAKECKEEFEVIITNYKQNPVIS